MDLKAVTLLLAWFTLCKAFLSTNDDCTTKTNWCDCLESNCGWCRQQGFSGAPKCGFAPDLIRRGCPSEDILQGTYYIEDRCRPPGTDWENKEICSGRGTCECGSCICDRSRNSNEQVFGTYCECDNYSCERSRNGLLCSGHGDCICGKCLCSLGWDGTDCSSHSGYRDEPLERATPSTVPKPPRPQLPPAEYHVRPTASYYYRPPTSTSSYSTLLYAPPSYVDCPVSTDTCSQRRGDPVCNNNGRCVCGECQCRPGYTGRFCEECSTCASKCSNYVSCVRCHVSKNVRNLDRDACQAHCGSVDVTVVEDATPTTIARRQCEVRENNGCTLTFVYGYDTYARKYVISARRLRAGEGICSPEDRWVERVCSSENADICGEGGNCNKETGECICYEGYSGRYCEECREHLCDTRCLDYRKCVECKYLGSTEYTATQCHEMCKAIRITGINKEDFKKSLRDPGRCTYADKDGNKVRFAFARDVETQALSIYVERDQHDAMTEHFSDDEIGTAGERRKCSLEEAVSKLRGRSCGSNLNSEICEPNGVCDERIGQCVCKDGYFGKYCEDCLTEECQGHCHEYKACVECKYLRTKGISQEDCDVRCYHVSVVGISQADYRKPLPMNSRRCSYVDDWGKRIRYAYTVDSRTRDPFIRVEAKDNRERFNDVVVDPDCDVVEAEELRASENPPLMHKPAVGGNETANLKVEESKPDSGISLIPSITLLCLAVVGALLLR